MKRFAALSMMVALSLSVAPAFAKNNAPDATLKLSGGSVAAGLGYSWGSGTLTYHGKSYPVDVKGLTAGDVGITKAEASGKVYHLKSLDDFDGNYTAVGAGAAVAGGGGVTTMRNQNGVTIDLVSTTKGVKVTLGGGGVELKLKK